MSRLTRLSLLALPIAAVVVLAAGCGDSGSGSPHVASLGSPKTTTTTPGTSGGGSTPGGSANGGSGGGANLTMKMQGGAKFAACMRKHGVPNFPDPTSSGAIQIGPSSGIDPSSPTFRAAQQTCRKLLPNGGQASPAQIAAAKRQALKFSACMRKHGVHDFPDPSFSGGGVSMSIRIGGKGSDLTPNSPIFQAAQKACQADLPGKLFKLGAPGAGSSGGK